MDGTGAGPAAAAAGGRRRAASGPQSLLVGAEDVRGMLGDPGMLLVDTRPHAEYARGHVPGAVNLDLFAFHWADTSAAGLDAFARQSARLMSFCGAGRARSVVFYDGTSGMTAARGVWMLWYLGRGDRARMLDGGFSGWTGGGAGSLPVETRPNAFRPSPFEARPDAGVVAGYEYIRDNLGRLALVDARSPAEYAGETVRAARAGHIPGAVNIDWTGNLRADGTFKDAAGLARLYGALPEDREVVAYCQGAYRAASTFVALRLLGRGNVRVYPGSWGEWGNMPELPAEL